MTFRKIGIILVLIVLVLAPLQLRGYLEGTHQLELARSYRTEGKLELAARSYSESIRWRIPLSSFADQAVAEMLALCLSSKLDQAQQLKYLRELKSAIYASRSMLSSLESVQNYDIINAEIARRVENPGQDIKKETGSDLHLGFQVMAQLCFWLWMASMLLLILRGYRPDGKLKKESFTAIAPIALMFFVLWMVSLYKA